MTEVTLTILSAGFSREFRMKGDRLVIGSAEGGGRGEVLRVEDDGLDPRHASINREGARVWVLDEGSTGGTLLNGRPVPPQGAPLSDGDEIFVGDHTNITVGLSAGGDARRHSSPVRAPRRAVEAAATRPPSSSGPPLALAAGLSVLCLGLLAVMAFALFGGKSAGQGRDVNLRAEEESRPAAEPVGPPRSEGAGEEPAPAGTQDAPAEVSQSQSDSGADGEAEQAPAGAKTYLQMSREEQLRFLEGRARHVSTMMGNRPHDFNDEVLVYIKQYVDGYARRVGNNVRAGWGADMRFVFARARTQYAPHIIRAFKARGVPPVVGLYLVMIETEYTNFSGENSARAAGLFQFIPGTAVAYGISPSERTNVEKMAPAAAHYMSDRIAEFGPDSMSVALAIAGYNRSPDSVRRDLRDVLAQQGSGKERSFWTLVANSDKLDHWFQGENIKYVPKFFAAAIVGETPWAFGLEMRKLSTYTTFEGGADEGQPAPTPGEPAAQATPSGAARSKSTSR